MYQEYGDLAQFLIVYIKEAHPADGWAMQVNPRVKYIKDPTNKFERFQVANSCVLDLGLTIPCVIDDMDNSTARAYKAHPDRLYVVGQDGRIVYAGGPGPMGFKPGEMKPYLLEELRKVGSLPR